MDSGSSQAGLFFALAYWALGSSVVAYSCLAFGAKHAREATHCLAYTAVQPVSAALLETLLVAMGWNRWHPENALVLPGGAQVLGALLVVTGVLMVAGEAQATATKALDAKVPTGSALD
mmetsp:Transcript_41967/g.116831  ORF Transcript_41967/g.116831 Transcript_41967/m.116831 type:complete len:119 (+) Transcript_41967:242-598(+)